MPYQAPPAAPADPTDLSMDPQAPGPAPGDPDADEQCRNGQHYVYDPKSDSFQGAGPCDAVHPVAEADPASASGASNVMQGNGNPFYADQTAPASNGRPPSAEELQQLQDMLQAAQSLKDQAKSKPTRAGVPGAAAAMQKGAGF